MSDTSVLRHCCLKFFQDSLIERVEFVCFEAVLKGLLQICRGEFCVLLAVIALGEAE